MYHALGSRQGGHHYNFDWSCICIGYRPSTCDAFLTHHMLAKRRALECGVGTNLEKSSGDLASGNGIGWSLNRPALTTVSQSVCESFLVLILRRGRPAQSTVHLLCPGRIVRSKRRQHIAKLSCEGCQPPVLNVERAIQLMPSGTSQSGSAKHRTWPARASYASKQTHQDGNLLAMIDRCVQITCFDRNYPFRAGRARLQKIVIEASAAMVLLRLGVCAA